MTRSAPLDQLLLSLDLAAACARLAGSRPGLATLCLDHLAHAGELARLLADQPGDPAGDEAAGELDRLTRLLGAARESAARACLSSSDGPEIELFGMVAAALATQETVLELSRVGVPAG